MDMEAYDHTAILGPTASVPTELATRALVPTLVLYGGASFPFMPDTARLLSDAMPQGELRALAGQAHEVDPDVLAPALAEFLAS
jgi:hypothetical protein